MHKLSMILLMLPGVLFTLNSCSSKEDGLPTATGHSADIHTTRTDTVTAMDREVAIKPPPLTEGIFPCMDCHSEMDPNPVRRKLEYMHDDIDAMFDHDRDNRWCLDCHDINQRDSLRLANGNLLAFTESQKLCGQCHGDKYRDWRVGVHGKRTGYWKGPKEYLLCVHCHNPHSPRFQPLEPMPPPVRQEDIR